MNARSPVQANRDAEYASAFDAPPESPESAARKSVAVILFVIVVLTCAVFGALMLPF